MMLHLDDRPLFARSLNKRRSITGGFGSSIALSLLLFVAAPCFAEFPSAVSVSGLDGSNGQRYLGTIDEDDELGYSVDLGGDINGDGLPDFVIGAPSSRFNGRQSGATYVVFGIKSGLPPAEILQSLDGTNGFQLLGNEGSRSGWSVGSRGDVNGDGIDDVVVGAPDTEVGDMEPGAIYVIFGQRESFTPVIELSSLDGTDGFAVTGDVDIGRFGRSVSIAGDINADGINDLVVGAPFLSQGYVIFGSTSPYQAAYDVGTLVATGGFKLIGASDVGWALDAGGDFNGDGIDDVVFGAPEGPFVERAGRAFVVYGSTEPFGQTIDLSQLDGVSGLVIEGAVVERTDLGRAVAWAGDINQDGFDDLAIGASYFSEGGLTFKGAAYLIFGSDSAPATIEAADLNGSNGFQMIGQTDTEFFGSSVAGADVTGDGFSDLLVGAHNGNGVEETGAVHVVFGSSEPFDAVVSYQDLDGTNGYRLLGDLADGNFGDAMSARDFNLDGIADVLVGAPDAEIGDYEAGAVYLVLGERRIKSLPVPLFNGLWMLWMIGLFAAVGWFGLRQGRAL